MILSFQTDWTGQTVKEQSDQDLHSLQIGLHLFEALLFGISSRNHITQTCPCNILQYFTAVKMIIFR